MSKSTNVLKYKRVKNYKHYIVYEDGTIKNIKTDYIFPRRISIKLHNGKVVKNIGLKRLIYETWYNKKLTRKDIIKFKDGNQLNYHYTNLINVNDIKKHRHHIKLDPTKKWKIIKKYPNYKISNYGDIFSMISNKMLKSRMDYNGYVYTKLNYKSSIFVHQLVYRTFKGKIKKGKQIDHRDQKRNNNYIENLRQVTASENGLNKEPVVQSGRSIQQYSLDNVFIKEWKSLEEIKTTSDIKTCKIRACCNGSRLTSSGFKWKYTNKIIDTSEYYSIITNDNRSYSNYKINNESKIINNYNVLMKSHISGGYYVITLKSDCNEYIGFKINRLVAMTFIPNDNPDYIEVNHLDENRLNNHVDNLQWCTHKQNITYSCGMKVNQINIKSNEIIKSFDSISDANAYFNKRRDDNGIRLVCHNKRKTAHGYKWSFIN